MPTIKEPFAAELELFRTEAESAIQFFYAWSAVHAVASKRPGVVRLLNEAPLFWNTSLGALQSASLIALGRLFDPNPENHSATRLLATAHKDLSIFSKQSLASRKRQLSDTADRWLPQYLTTAYVPTGGDFRRLKHYLADRRRTYEANYRPLRHKVFAHRGVVSRDEISDLFAKTDLRELQRLLVFLRRLHEALWQLYYNGHKPTLRPARFSVQRMLDAPYPSHGRSSLQERLVHEVREFLIRHSARD